MGLMALAREWIQYQGFSEYDLRNAGFLAFDLLVVISAVGVNCKHGEISKRVHNKILH
jgi:hypothetical protein